MRTDRQTWSAQYALISCISSKEEIIIKDRKAEGKKGGKEEGKREEEKENDKQKEEESNM
jgi:hypothetical protein